MKSIRITNLRSLADTGKIELKLINILVGKNSSGKSTFLRAFPLLRQSMEVRGSGPILWYGRLVDFGTYQEAKRAEEDNLNMSFQFEFEIEWRNESNSISRKNLMQSIEPTVVPIIVRIELLETSQPDNEILHRISLQLGTNQIRIEAKNGREVSAFQINSSNLLRYGGKYVLAKREGILPNMLSFYKPTEGTPRYMQYDHRIIQQLESLLQQLDVVPEELLESLQLLNFETDAILLSSLKSQFGGIESSKKLKMLTEESLLFKEIRDLVLAYNMQKLLMKSNMYLADYFSSIKYVAPLRAPTERYYRLQNLAVDEIDSQGTNLAMFLKSLSELDRKNFEEWTSRNLGFVAKAIATGGHISIKLFEGSDTEGAFNLADMGFGFSQLLPLVAQLWSSITQGTGRPNHLTPFRNRNIIFAIEQPELHLHPALQSRVAEVFFKVAETAKKEQFNFQLILETHSEAIINRMGALIAQSNETSRNPLADILNKSQLVLNRLTNKDIQVLVFNRQSAKYSEISIARFRLDGSLDNWPFGFFHADFQY